MKSWKKRATFVLFITVLNVAVILFLWYEGSYRYDDVRVTKAVPTYLRDDDDDDDTTTSNNRNCLVDHHTFFEDKIFRRQDTMNGTASFLNRTGKEEEGIPKVFHFFVKSKCVPNRIHQNLQLWVEALPEEYSIYVHDLQEIHSYLSRPRSDMPFIQKAHACAFQHEAILDLARLVYLYDYGGISVDLDHIPGEAFFHMENGTQSSSSSSSLLLLLLLHEYPTHDGRPLSYVVEEQTAHTHPRFIAASPQYPMLYTSLLQYVSVQYRQHLSHLPDAWTYNASRNMTYHIALDQLKSDKQRSNAMIVLKYHSKLAPGGIVQNNLVNTSHFLKHTSLTAEETMDITLNHNDDNGNIKYCVNLTDNSYQLDVDELLKIVGVQDNRTCPNHTSYESNVFLPESINVPGRKIPNVVHMTAKERCFTESYHQNNNLWKRPGHSFFIHDNDAVYRLFYKYDWNEFPLLNETLACINSGAMLADVWRYLLMWKFGGIYSDIDDSPGYAWANGSFIEDNMDAVFEVEGGGFPSQYFFAISPHHPVAYLMMSIALEFLFSNPKPLDRRRVAPFITGPRASKNGIIMSIGGNGYPPHGEYRGLYDRNITMVGSPRDAKSGKYVRRWAARSISPDDEKIMGMEHYQGPTDVQLPTHTCRKQILRDLGVVF